MKKITSICLTIFLGVNIVSAYAARGEQLAILSEDFSAFTEEPNPRLPRVNFRQEMQ